MPIASHGTQHAAVRTPWWKGSTQISVFRAYTGRPERSRTALSIGSRAVPQFIDCRRAVHQTTTPTCIHSVRAFETSRSALYPLTPRHLPRRVSAKSDKIHTGSSDMWTPRTVCPPCDRYLLERTVHFRHRNFSIEIKVGKIAEEQVLEKCLLEVIWMNLLVELR